MLLLISIIEDKNAYSIQYNTRSTSKTYHIMELETDGCWDNWKQIIRHVDGRIQMESRDDYIVIDTINDIIHCNNTYPTNVIYVLNIIANYCNIRKYRSKIVSNTLYPSNISKLLYKWMGRNKDTIQNTRLLYYTTVTCFLFMSFLIVACFLLLFVPVLT